MGISLLGLLGILAIVGMLLYLFSGMFKDGR